MWKITRDIFAEAGGERRQLPYSSDFDPATADFKAPGDKFRLLDDDGEVYCEGEFFGDSSGEDAFRPLDEYGRGAHGCTRIEYREFGRWVEV